MCELCKQNKKFINAHIIPAWAYRYLYPDDEARKISLILIGTKRTKRRPIGIYDKSILCLECDQFLGKFDLYGKEVFLDSKPKKFGESDKLLIIPEVNLYKIKIFLLSVLWRASLSGQEELERFNLGVYEEKIGDLLRQIQFGQSVDRELSVYDFVVTKFDEGNYPDVANKNIMLPRTQRTADGLNLSVLYLPLGLKIFIKTDKRQFHDDVRKIIARDEHGGLLIVGIGNFEESEEFKILLQVARSQDE